MPSLLELLYINSLIAIIISILQLRESYPKYKNEDDVQEFQKAKKEIKRSWLILFFGVFGVIIAFAMLTR